MKFLRAWVRVCCVDAETEMKGVDGAELPHYQLYMDRVCFTHLRFVAGRLSLLTCSIKKDRAKNTLMLLYHYRYHQAAHHHRAAITPLHRNHHIILLPHQNTAQQYAAAYNIIQKRRFRIGLQFLLRRCVHWDLSCHNVLSASLCAPSLQAVQLPPRHHHPSQPLNLARHLL